MVETARLSDADLLRADTLHGNHAGWCEVHDEDIAEPRCDCGSWAFGVMYVDMLANLRAARAQITILYSALDAVEPYANRSGLLPNDVFVQMYAALEEGNEALRS